jgi:serine-type D-Ala-D-Ala carboxypeptidase/endopeptidase
MALATRTRLLAFCCLLALCACGGGGSSASTAPPAADPWQAVSAAIDAAATRFPSGVTVEIATPQGVVYSKRVGAFSNDSFGEVASASKWVSASVILRLVEQGVLTLDTRTADLLRDNAGQPWSGNLGVATLRDLLSFQTSIAADTSAAAGAPTLAEAANVIYEAQKSVARPPGTWFVYGNNHLRIAARMAEVAAGKPWAQIFDEQLRLPLGWSAATAFTFGASVNNPNPAGGLVTSGREYMRFLTLQLRRGLDGSNRLLAAATIDAQRAEQWRPTTVILFSPYTSLGKSYHYGLGVWRECDAPADIAACDAALRVSSTGAFGFAPWIDVQGDYAAAVMTRQPTQQGSSDFVPSEDLKAVLATLVPAALAQRPPVIRAVP